MRTAQGPAAPQKLSVPVTTLWPCSSVPTCARPTRSPRRPSAAPRSCRCSWPTRRAGRSPPRTRRPRSCASGPLTVVVHSPYVVNLASPNNRIRIPSRKLVAAARRAARPRSARSGWSCTAGTSPRGEDAADGVENWRKFLARQADEGGFPVPDPDREHRGRRQRDGPPVRRAGPPLGRRRRVRRRLLPRHLPRLRRRRGAGRRRRPGQGDHRPDRPGAPQRLARRVRLGRATGTPTSATAPSTPDALVAVCAAAGAPVVVETPAEGQAADIAFLRERLGS